MMTQSEASSVVFQHAPRRAEGVWDISLWYATHMGGWLNLVTLALLVSKWTGTLHLGWGLVFLPTLLYMAFMVLLIIAGYSVDAVCQWVNSPDLTDSAPTKSSSPHIALDPSERKPSVI
jgi:hypothetical protein